MISLNIFYFDQMKWNSAKRFTNIIFSPLPIDMIYGVDQTMDIYVSKYSPVLQIPGMRMFVPNDHSGLCCMKCFL